MKISTIINKYNYFKDKKERIITEIKNIENIIKIYEKDNLFSKEKYNIKINELEILEWKKVIKSLKKKLLNIEKNLVKYQILLKENQEKLKE